MGELHDRAALITGGTTGLGLAIAGAFLREGARVVITGRDETLGSVAERRLRADGHAWFVRADAADEVQVQGSVAEAIRLLGGVDVLVNNAGIGVEATPLATPLVDFDAVMAVNLRGCFAYAQASFPSLEARGGSMIHVGSDAGLLGEVDIGIYSVSKAALHMLSNVLAIEGGRRGVRSNVIAPGDTEPGMRHMAPVGSGDPTGDPPEVRPEDPPEDDLADWPRPPLGRLGRAEDVAEAAVYLASDRASFVNGVVLTLDGGMRAGYNTGTFLPKDQG